MAELLSYATKSSVFPVDGATSITATITPSNEAYCFFDTSEDGTNWTLLIPSTIYDSPVTRTFTAAEIGNYLRCSFYGGIGTVTLQADGISVPPLAVDSPTTISGTPELGQTLTMTPATISGGTTPYTYTYEWEMLYGTWDVVSRGSLTYSILEKPSYVGNKLRAVTIAEDSSSDWEVPSTTIKSISAEVTIQDVPITPIIIVTSPVASGQTMVSKLVSCAPPTFTGGDQDTHVLSYQWFDAAGPGTQPLHTGQEWELEEAVVGSSVYCRVAVGDGETTVTDDSNTIGPVIPQPTIGDVTATVNDMDYNLTTNPTLTVLMNDPLPVAVSISGDAVASYAWDARADYPLVVSAQAASMDLTLPQAGSAIVTCLITGTNASDSPKSLTFNFWVVDAQTWAELQEQEAALS